MNRSIIFSNTALSIKKLEKISRLLDINESIQNLDIYSTRYIKENKIKINDSKTFHSIRGLIEYINENDIRIINDIEINIYYKNKNKARLKYENFNHRWELSYYDQDSNVDSLIYNLKPLIRNNPLKFFRQYRMLFLSFLCGMWFIILLTLGKTPPTTVSNVFNSIYIVLFIDIFFVKNVAFREYKFLTKNKDDIILSIISYILGVITPYVINWIISLF